MGSIKLTLHELSLKKKGKKEATMRPEGEKGKRS